MTRNYKKNRNINMPLDRNSETLRDLVEDATRHNMERQIGKFTALRLADYYQLRRQGHILPEGVAATPAAPSMLMPTAASSNGHTPIYQQPQQQTHSSDPSQKELEQLANRPEVINISPDASTLDENLDFFLEED